MPRLCNLLPKFCKLLPKNISKITQKHVGEYNVKFTCPKKSTENFNLFSHAQKIDEKVLEILMARQIYHFYIAPGELIKQINIEVQMAKDTKWKKSYVNLFDEFSECALLRFVLSRWRHQVQNKNYQVIINF